MATQPSAPRALLLTAAALPLTGWTVHAVLLYRQLAETQRDPLTGLLRRDAYTTRARKILRRHGNDTAVIMIDCDHFKTINDTHGHAAGDTVLMTLADRLTAWAGPGAAIGRLGGDEFAIVLPLPRAQRTHRLHQLMHLLHSPTLLDNGRTIDVGASVGAATPDQIASQDLSVLQRAADAALYDGKHTGRAHLAHPHHRAIPTINGRRAGRPGTTPRKHAA
ncbi:GGDEF domain-containing protein [Streptomyces arenae]|nr:GGDEF domain-containing protein [Streptomyces arenae]